MYIYKFVSYIYKYTYAGTTTSSSAPPPAVSAAQEGGGSGVAPNEGGKGEGGRRFTSTRLSVEKGTHSSQVSKRTTSTKHIISHDKRSSRCPVYMYVRVILVYVYVYVYKYIFQYVEICKHLCITYIYVYRHIYMSIYI